jgi:apolipoprotein N-acyltransferase
VLSPRTVRAALVIAIGVLGVIGLALQAAAGWASIPGDALWAACALTFGLMAFIEPSRQRRSRAGLVSMVAQSLFGLSTALVMVYWILVDAGRIARIDPVYTALPIGLGLIFLAALRQRRRGARPT